jgi:hypothetical protein
MAKATAKKTTEKTVKKTETPAKKAAPRKTAKASAITIDQACEQALETLKNLGHEENLQSEIAWCIGSYRFDNNPIGLLQNGTRALEVLRAAKAKNAKAVPAKVISDLQKALGQA